MDVLFIVIPLRITPEKYNSLRLKSYVRKKVYTKVVVFFIVFFICNGNISCALEKHLKSN